VLQRWAMGWIIGGGAQVSAEVANFSLHHRVQTASGAH